VHDGDHAHHVERGERTNAEAAQLQPGTQSAGAAVALTHGINANIVHRWLREHPAKPAPKPINPFIPLPLPAPQVEDAEAVRSAPGGCADIRVEIRRGTGVVTVNWPVEAASSCADWLRDWLR